ncbi:MAG: hypothetical protein IPK82_06155 [Polyangiaceae bacterium]|nr:hypothetical protein [Polyangiaceae bacterium]
MAHIIYFVKGDPSIVATYKKALAPVGDFDFIVVAAKPDGLSSAYGKLADKLKNPATGRIAPELFSAYGAPRAPYETITLATFSAGYKFAERMLAIPDDANAIDAYVAIDSIHADFDEDKTAKDTQIAPFVEFAKRAQAKEKLFWIGHSDVVTPQVGKFAYASTTQVANEIIRLAGGESGFFKRRAYNVETNPVKEHVAAIQKWGPGFLAEAMKELLSGRQPE